MREHHVKSIENLIEKISKDENFIALILAGSLAHGTEKEFSDIDAYLVVTEEDFARRLERNDITYSDTSVCTYKGGYIDGKIIDIELSAVLRKRSSAGNERQRIVFHPVRIYPEINTAFCKRRAVKRKVYISRFFVKNKTYRMPLVKTEVCHSRMIIACRFVR